MTDNKERSIRLKLIASLISVFVFLLIASPFMYRCTSWVFGKWVAVNGCPSFAGHVLHAIVFGLVIFSIMYIPIG
jgi:hypothetical protein